MRSLVVNLIYVFFFVITAVAFFISTEYVAMFINQIRNPSDACSSPSSSSSSPSSSSSSPSSSSSSSSPSSFGTKWPVDVCDVVLIVLTGSNYHNTRLPDIQNTYMKHTCQTDVRKNILFVSDVLNETIPTIGVPCENGYDNSLCCKVVYGWREAYKLYPKAKYYLQLDDDSYVVMKNLIPFLSHFDPGQPLFTGHPLYVTLDENGGMTKDASDDRSTPSDLVYAAGWLGIMTRPSLDKIFQTKLDQVFFPVCDKHFWPDLVTGIIMRSAGILFNEETFGYYTGWGASGYDPLKPGNHEIFSKTIGTHAHRDTKMMFVYDQQFYPRHGA